MYDISKLTTPDDCRTVMARAQQRGMQDVYAAVFKRFVRLLGMQTMTHLIRYFEIFMELWRHTSNF